MAGPAVRLVNMSTERANRPTELRDMGLGSTKAQREVLRYFAEQVSGSPVPMQSLSCSVVGIEDLANRREAQALLEALQLEDWTRVSSHQAIAGTNNLLLGILVRLQEDSATSDYWVAMRSPFDLLDSPEIVAYGRLERRWPSEVSPVCLEKAGIQRI